MVTTGGTDCRMSVASSDRRHQNARVLNLDGPTLRLDCRVGTASGSRATGPARSLRTAARRFKEKHASREAKQERVLHELLLTSRERFVGVAHNILQNRDDAEDAVQDAFLSACRYSRNFEGRSAVTTWFTRVVMNAALLIRRKRKNGGLRSFHDLDAGDTVLIETMPDRKPNPELACSQTESVEFLDAGLKKMKPLLREAIWLTYYDELSASEASARLGISLVTYKSRLLRGKRLLKARARRRM
jgi:RNA polymerase sigma-70 factor (ECF subfamily)